MITNIIGIDPSSKKLAFCSTWMHDRSNNPTLKIVRLPEGIDWATGAAFRESLLFFREHTSAVVFMEEPVVAHHNPRSTIVQAQVGGAVMAAANEARLSLYLVHNMSWKKFFCGRGNAKKEDIAASLQESWPQAYDLASGDQDLIDACGVNRYGADAQRITEAVVAKILRRANGNGSRPQG